MKIKTNISISMNTLRSIKTVINNPKFFKIETHQRVKTKAFDNLTHVIIEYHFRGTEKSSGNKFDKVVKTVNLSRIEKNNYYPIHPKDLVGCNSTYLRFGGYSSLEKAIVLSDREFEEQMSLFTNTFSFNKLS